MQSPENDLIGTALASITMDMVSSIDMDQASVQNLIQTLNSDAATESKQSALIDAMRQPLSRNLRVEAVEVLE